MPYEEEKTFFYPKDKTTVLLRETNQDLVLEKQTVKFPIVRKNLQKKI